MDYLTPIIDTLRETHASYMRVVGDIMFAWNIFTRVSRFHVKLCKSWSLQEGCSNSKTYNNTPLLNCTCATGYLVTNFSLKGLEFYASAASACRKVCCARNCCREQLTNDANQNVDFFRQNQVNVYIYFYLCIFSSITLRTF